MKNPQNVHTHITAEVKKYFTTSGHTKAVLGLSGGIDSALTLKLLSDALGPQNVTALIMPETGVTKDENTFHAKGLCKYLQVKHHVVPINKYLLDLLHLPWKPSRLSQMNTKARARAIVLYNFSNTETALVVGASNKSELLLGYGTKYGDLAHDINPIGNLYKTDVYALSEYLGLPDEIIKKAPSAELYKGQTDEEELGLPYKEIDKVLKAYESQDQDKAKTMEKLEEENPNFQKIRILDLLERIKKNEHKSKGPYIIGL